jgi:hypothetical protein
VKAVHDQISKYSGIPLKDVADKVSNAVPTYIPKFTEYVPIKSRDLSDQYYFDITLYVTYLVAAELIPDSVSRIPLRKGVGLAVYNVLKDRNLIQLPSPPVKATGTSASAGEAAENMAALSDGVSRILNAFTASGILSSYEFDAEDLADYTFAKASFSDVSIAPVTCTPWLTHTTHTQTHLSPTTLTVTANTKPYVLLNTYPTNYNCRVCQ